MEVDRLGRRMYMGHLRNCAVLLLDGLTMLDQICPTRHHIDWFLGFMGFLDRTGQLTAGRHIFIQELRFPNTFHLPNKDTIFRSNALEQVASAFCAASEEQTVKYMA